MAPFGSGSATAASCPLTAYSGAIRRSLTLDDVVYVHVVEGKSGEGRSGESKPGAKGQKGATTGATAAQAQLRVRPKVQGAALVLENKTGRILAMAGGFSYPLSQLNRAAQTQRQPGSAIKPLTYLAALQAGLQPNTLILDEPITLPPIGSTSRGRDGIVRDIGAAREEDYWTPRNFDNALGGIYTLRRGLEHSRNIITARLLDGGIDADPERSLDRVCALAVEAKIYADCIRYYPFVLGAEPVRMIDLAAFYAAVANEGARPQPHGIDSIEQNGETIYRYPAAPLPFIGSADRTSFYQLKTMLQGVVARGTARAIASLSPYVAGKTGTTRRRGRRLVRRLHQRRDRRGLGRLRQWRRQAPLARPQRDRIARRVADLRADHRRGVGGTRGAESGAQRPFARGAEASHRLADRLSERRPGDRRARELRRAFPPRRRRPFHRDAKSALGESGRRRVGRPGAVQRLWRVGLGRPTRQGPL